MNQQKHKNSFKTRPVRQQPLIRHLKWCGITLGLIAMMVIAGVLLYSGNQKNGGLEHADYENLVSDWGRLDGDYINRISSINPDGTIQAAYFNPNPIHVAQATISLRNNSVVLQVKLQDAGYPGSKYDLIYKPEEDILQGTYFQAQIQELYDVVFLRKNDESRLNIKDLGKL